MIDLSGLLQRDLCATVAHSGGDDARLRSVTSTLGRGRDLLERPSRSSISIDAERHPVCICE